MNISNKKLILTGGTGLIGREILEPLKNSGFEIYALTRAESVYRDGIHWINCDIFDFLNTKDVLKNICADYLLHLAWVTTGDYLNSNLNYDFLTASINLLKLFKEYGGKRVVFAGTCFEYKFKEDALKETDALDCDKTIYTFCKNKLREISTNYCKHNDISFGYGRIFYVYGKNESKTRLTGMLLDKLSNNQEVIINSGDLFKDYMYTKDIANAFVKFLESNIDGVVNISTGKAVSIKEYANLIGEKLNKKYLIKFVDLKNNQPPVILGDNSKLINEVGYKIKYTLEQGIDEVIAENNV